VQSLTAVDLILSFPRGGEGWPLDSLCLLPHNVVNSPAPPTHNVPWRVLAPVVRSAKKLEVVVDLRISLVLTLIFAPLSDTDSALYAVLDEALCALELQLELEVDAATYVFILPFFPRLEASGAVCIIRWLSTSESPWATDML
jgi:hypothetical protein